MPKLVLATLNENKILEIKDLLQNLPFSILTLRDLNYSKTILETGKTFEENALLKVMAVGNEKNEITLAEDSGLEIDALGGKPGIYSARFSNGTDNDRVLKVLNLLKNVPHEKRSARFTTVVAIYNPRSKEVKTFQGTSNGYITTKEYGSNGFGYDPIFYNSDLRKTNSEATLEEKNKISHRAKAFGQFKAWCQPNAYWFQR